MSFILSAEKISKSYNTVTLFEHIHFHINPTDVIGLIGSNGVGKTTFLRILAGITNPDEGKIIVSPHLKIGYLPQEPLISAEDNLTVKRYLEDATANLGKLSDMIATIADQLNENPTDKVLLETFGNLQEQFEQQGGYTFDYRMESILEGLSLHAKIIDSKFIELSGGQRARIALAAQLLQQPDLLLLDEPTNHLDLKGIEWLEDYIQKYPKGVVITSHDRKFLDQTARTIVEIPGDKAPFIRFGGNYSNYLIEKEIMRERKEAGYLDHKEEVTQLKRLIRTQSFSKKRVTKAKDNNKMAYDHNGERHQQQQSRTIAQAKEKLQKLEKTAPKRPPLRSQIWLNFTPTILRSECAIEINKLSFGYGDNLLINNLSLDIYNGERICIVGANGSGKSTLLKLLAGTLSPSTGAINLAPTASIAYLSQHSETLSPNQTVIKEYKRTHHADDALLRKELAMCGLFGDERVHTLVADLSYGQKQKLKIAKLVASNANVLLLDEPTNHLDLETLESLENALLQFEGIIITATHDRWFIEQIGTTTLTVQ